MQYTAVLSAYSLVSRSCKRALQYLGICSKSTPGISTIKLQVQYVLLVAPNLLKTRSPGRQAQFAAASSIRHKENISPRPQTHPQLTCVVPRTWSNALLHDAILSAQISLARAETGLTTQQHDTWLLHAQLSDLGLALDRSLKTTSSLKDWLELAELKMDARYVQLRNERHKRSRSEEKSARFAVELLQIKTVELPGAWKKAADTEC